MTNNNERIDQLLIKIEALLKRQEFFSREIETLKKEIEQLKISEIVQLHNEKISEKKETIIEKIETPETTTKVEIPVQPETEITPTTSIGHKVKESGIKRDIEKFIGENLINKIGIAITVIGVSIGAKYAIDNELISPLTRVILGYLVGFGLLGFAIRLKKNYDNFSAVLLSGAIAILYFMTYAALTFYGLFSQIVTFILMVVITVFTVLSAINYNKQVIAHIGLVGAYAIPFLLSEDPGNIKILLSYIAIINIGILIVAFKKYWKFLFYAAFLMTWGIYLMWFSTSFDSDVNSDISLSFGGIFFIIFYSIFLAFKLIEKEKFEFVDVFFILFNSFIFYGIGYEVLDSHEIGKSFIGLFTLVNALIHFVISFIIYKQKLADRNLFYLIAGLVLLFLTIAVPVQLDGNWVTLLWVGEAALLFWIGRSKKESIYEFLSYPVMILAFFSLLQDWGQLNDQINNISTAIYLKPFLNVEFLSSLLFVGAFGFINWIHQKTDYPKKLLTNDFFLKIISFTVPIIFLLSFYNTFRIEIESYWALLYSNSRLSINSVSPENLSYSMNSDLLNFKTLWLLNYTMVFLAALSFFNFVSLKNKNLGLTNLFLNLVLVFFFLSIGLFEISELRESYLLRKMPSNYEIGIYNLLIRYISILFVGILLIATWKFVLRDFLKINFKVPFDILLTITICWITSSELIHWLDIALSEQSYKLALSIFWGVYSLILIIFGIWKNKKHIRILAFSLFGITIIKLFFYDISELDTISKTIVFISLGLLLLITSFLYNKYRQRIIS